MPPYLQCQNLGRCIQQFSNSYMRKKWGNGWTGGRTDGRTDGRSDFNKCLEGFQKILKYFLIETLNQ